MAKPTIILTRADIAQHVDPVQAITLIEQAMAEHEKGEDYLPPKAIYADLPVGTSGLAAAACITGITKLAGLMTMKVGQERTDNPTRNLPTTNSWTLTFDPATGELLMFSDGTMPTMLRTAAAAAVATRHLARPDARTLAVIGAGQLGRQCARLVSTVRDFERVLLHDQQAAVAEAAAAELASLISAPVELAAARAACEQADVIVTATNSTEPIVMADWVRPGTHLSCMGSDLHQKIECEMSLLPACRRFADQTEHAAQRGEVSQAIENDLLDADCFIATLGKVITGQATGRISDDDITLYDGVGIGIQDTTIMRAIYDQAQTHDLGTRIALSG